MIDQRRAHHNTVGQTRDGRRLFRSPDTETDADRQVGMATQTGDRFLDVFQRGGTGAGHTGHRDVVDEAGAAVENGRQAHIVGGWRGQANEVQARGLRRVAQLAVMFGRQVDHDQTINASLLGFGNEARYAVHVDRVEVTHQHQRRFVVVLAELANHLQGFRQILFGTQRTDVGELDGRAVSHRVGEGHAQLDHIGASRRQALEDCQGGVIARVASGHEGHQGGTVLFLEFGKTRLQAAHQCFSCLDCSMWCITVCMSLSPRPDRLTTIR
ncbi:hypothetical protein D3C78_1248830 [compost metagenome]